MKSLLTLALAGAAVLAIGGGTMAAAAAANDHVLTVRLPDGAVEQIRYVGDVAPTVRLAAPVSPIAVFEPFGGAMFADPGFAQLQRISAQMDREAAAMFAGLDGASGLGGLTAVNLGRLPAGAQGYSMVSTANGGAVCTRRTEYISSGDGKAPRVISHTSGDCGQGHAPTGAAAASPPASPAASGLVQASYRTGG